MQSFHFKYGAVGEILANELVQLSLDVLGEIAQYLFCNIAQSGKHAMLFQEFLGATDENVNVLACAPDGKIWIGDNHGITVVSETVPIARWPIPCNSIAFTNEHAYVVNRFVRVIAKYDLHGGYCSNVFKHSVPYKSSGLCEAIAISNDYKSFYLIEGESFTQRFSCWKYTICHQDGIIDCQYSVPRHSASLSVAIDRKDHVYLLDSDSRWIDIYAAPGVLSYSVFLGNQFPVAMAFDSKDNLFVVTGSNIAVFTPDHKPISVTCHALSFPRRVCVDTFNRIYIADATKSIKVFGFPF